MRPDRTFPSPSPDDNPQATPGAARALAGLLLTTLGLVIAIVGGIVIKDQRLAGEIVGEGATVASMLAVKVAGCVTLGLGLLLFVAGMALLGKGGKALVVRFGCLLFAGGIAAYVADLMLNDGPNKLARLFGLLAAALGIFVTAAAKGWLGGRSIFDD